MATIRTRNRSDKLFVDFRYMGKRCRETTNLVDNPANRKKLEQIIVKMEAEITLGLFEYDKYFPKSDKAKEMMALKDRAECLQSDTPSFAEFSKLWFSEKEIEWRDTYKRKVIDIIDKYLIPAFGNKPIHIIEKTDVLTFRTSLAKVTYGKANKHLSAARINSIMVPLGMILQEASIRYKFDSPYQDIKMLKLPKTDIHPLTLEEVWKFIKGVRKDYRDYYTVRFFTGMRSSEIDGLRWEHIDFNRREILIRQALVKGQIVPPKTQESYREISMSPWVFESLQNQYKATYGKSDYVFCSINGQPLNYGNVNKRVWHPTLELLKLKKRNAYQTRHTAATIWLASGESPEWIASQMGHATTKMLFNVYSRYVPNMTRRDGSAFENLVKNSQLSLLDSGISEKPINETEVDAHNNDAEVSHVSH